MACVAIFAWAVGKYRDVILPMTVLPRRRARADHSPRGDPRPRPTVRLKPSSAEWLGEVPETWEVRRMWHGPIGVAPIDGLVSRAAEVDD
jgi:hypothetical protein